MAAVPSPAALILQEVHDGNLAVLAAAHLLANKDPLACGQLLGLSQSDVTALAGIPRTLIHDYSLTGCCLLLIEGIDNALNSDGPMDSVAGHSEFQQALASEAERAEQQALIHTIKTHQDLAFACAHRAALVSPRFAKAVFGLPSMKVAEELGSITEARRRACFSHLTFRLHIGAIRAIVGTFHAETDALPPARRKYDELGIVARTSTVFTKHAISRG